jgi:hypothetical protein
VLFGSSSDQNERCVRPGWDFEVFIGDGALLLLAVIFYGVFWYWFYRVPGEMPGKKATEESHG